MLGAGPESEAGMNEPENFHQGFAGGMMKYWGMLFALWPLTLLAEALGLW